MWNHARQKLSWCSRGVFVHTRLFERKHLERVEAQIISTLHMIYLYLYLYICSTYKYIHIAVPGQHANNKSKMSFRPKARIEFQSRICSIYLNTNARIEFLSRTLTPILRVHIQTPTCTHMFTRRVYIHECTHGLIN